MSVAAGAVTLFGICLVAASLLRRIIWPEIIAFPWDGDESKEGKKENRIVILAGSYNPPHRGHLEMLGYLSRRCVSKRP